MSMTTTDNRLARIEDKINPELAGAIAVNRKSGGLALTNMRDIMEFAKLMSTAKNAVPKHCQEQPGVCLAICVQAFEWGMSPFAVANQSYSAKEGQPLGYMSQLIHAVIESRAPLQRRLRAEYTGEGPTRAIKVIGWLKGEDEPFEYQSPMKKDIKVRNSPLWDADLDQQLWYYGTRGWSRKWCPDVLMGIYTPDEIETMPIPEHMQDVTPTPNLAERLANRQGPATEGFPPPDVDILAQMTGEVITPEELASGLAGLGRLEKANSAPETGLGEPIVGPLVPERPEPDPLSAAKPASRRGRRAKPLSADAPDEPAQVDPPSQDPSELAEPSTPAEYMHWLITWLATYESVEKISERWRSTDEQRRRNRCYLTNEQRDHAIATRDGRIRKLRCDQ